jgi:hypothetical protein
MNTHTHTQTYIMKSENVELSLGSVVRTDGGGDIGGDVVRLAEPVLQMRRAPHRPQRPFSCQIRLRVKHSSSLIC